MCNTVSRICKATNLTLSTIYRLIQDAVLSQGEPRDVVGVAQQFLKASFDSQRIDRVGKKVSLTISAIILSTVGQFS